MNNNELVDIFSSNEFNSKIWINNLLNNSINNNNNNSSLTDQNNLKIELEIENILSNYLSKLQLYQIELNISLENVTSESLLIVPKSIREVDKIRKESILLKNKIKSISSKIENINNQNPKSMKTISQIEKLDLIKSRMENSIRSLKEAEKLLSFSKTVDQLFSSNDYLMISDKLEEVKQSLSVLSDVPEFREQSQSFNIYQDRLDNQLKPPLQQSLLSKDLQSCIKYLKIFTNIQRKDKFFNYYYQVRIDPLKLLWNSYVYSSSTAAGSNSAFNNWLSKFYDEVLIMINSEYNWLSGLCPNDYVQVLENLIIHLFTTTINQNVSSRIDQAINSNQPQQPIKINELLSIYKTTCSFIKSLSPIFPNILSLMASSTSNTIQQSSDKLFKIILEPYKYFQNKFSEYEIKSLKSQLQLLLPKKAGSGMMMMVGNINEFTTIIKNIDNQMIPKFFLMIQSSIERFFDFTHTTDIDSYVNQVLNQIFIELSNIIRDSINELKLISNLSSNYIIGSNGNFPTFSTTTATTTTGTTSSNTLEVDPLKKISGSHTRTHSRGGSTGSSSANSSATLQNWEYFQGAMSLLQSIHKLLNKFQQFDNSTCLGIIHYLGNEGSSGSGNSGSNDQQFINNIRKFILGQDLNKIHKLQQSVQNLEEIISSTSTSTSTSSTSTTTIDINKKPYLLQESFNQLSKLLSISQHFVYETMIYFIKNKLKELPKIVSNEWNNSGSGSGNNSSTGSGSNLSYISQITDHLLTIPQQLDPYSEEELTRFSLSTSLLFPIKTNSNIENEFYQNLLIQYQKEKQNDDEKLIIEKKSKVVSTTEGNDEDNEGEEEKAIEEDDDELEDGIAHQWITIIAKSTEKLYLQTIVEIIQLNESSCQQLSNDIGYLFNVLSALGVSPEPLLQKTQLFLEMNRETFTSFYHQQHNPQQQQQPSSSQLSNAEKNICNLIAKMRNIK